MLKLGRTFSRSRLSSRGISTYTDLASSIGTDTEFLDEFKYYGEWLRKSPTFAQELDMLKIPKETREHNGWDSRMTIVNHRFEDIKNLACSILYRGDLLCSVGDSHVKVPLVINPMHATTAQANFNHWESESRRAAYRVGIDMLFQGKTKAGVFLQSHHRYSSSPAILENGGHKVLVEPVALHVRNVPGMTPELGNLGVVEAVTNEEEGARLQGDTLRGFHAVNGFAVCDTVLLKNEENGSMEDLRGLYQIRHQKTQQSLAWVQLTAEVGPNGDLEAIFSSPVVNEECGGTPGHLAALISTLKEELGFAHLRILVDPRDPLVPVPAAYSAEQVDAFFAERKPGNAQALNSIALALQPDPARRQLRRSGVTISGVPLRLEESVLAGLATRPFKLSAEMVFRDLYWAPTQVVL